MKVTPLKKQSKKNQRKFYAAKRGSWNGVSPVTRVVQSKQIYDRKRMKREDCRELVEKELAESNVIWTRCYIASENF